MSGLEFIVGTVLAGVPIALEAYDRYWDLSEGFNTFRHYSKELVKLDTILRTQKTLFRGNVIKLLTAITNNPEKARELLTDTEKRRLDDLKLHIRERNRLESLKEMFTSWQATLELLLNAVTTICREVEQFRSANSVPAGQSLPSRELLKQLPKRFRLCWRKNEVQDSIKELRDFTADFNELTTRIINELKEIQTTAPPAPEMLIRHRASQLNSLEKYRQIRSASHRLYNTFALRWTCTRHKKHAASISLVEDDTLPQPGDALDGIKFDVAISCDADSPTCPDVPIWLEVESVDANSFEFGSQKREEPSDTDSNDAWTSVMDTMTKHTQPIVIKKAEKIRNKLVKKAVRFQSTASNLVAAISTTRSSSTTLVQVTGGEDDKDKDKGGTIGPFPTNDPATADSIIDLEMIEDFCRLFQVPRPVWSSKPVGYIRNLGLHRFYLPPPQRRLSGPQKSLAEIITWISEDEFSRSLPRTSMAHLASSLAAAVLQYHSTPWLPETWQSSHVRFFGVGELSQDSSSISLGTPYTPYFKVEFSKPEKGKYVDLNRSATGRAMAGAPEPPKAILSTSAATCPADETAIIPPTSLARNELLFRFGIVLLELGYSQPWARLRRKALSTLPPQPHRRTDYHAAEKLAQTSFLCNRMGPRFPRIVRKCLGCDFGLGENDLASEELQGSFLVDVVGALQDVDRGLRELERRLGGGEFS